MPRTTEQHIRELVPALQPLVEQFLAKAREQGYDLKITHSYRSIDEQNGLYLIGRRGVAGEKVVTNAKGGTSQHNFRRAFDVYDNQRAYDIDWEKLGTLGESLGLVWGGRWTVLRDRPHFEYRGPAVVLQAVKAPEKDEDMELRNWIRQSKLETYQVPGDDKVYLTFHVKDPEMFEKTLECAWADIKTVSAAKPSEIVCTESYEPITEIIYKKKG